jgi:hypothetical protein
MMKRFEKEFYRRRLPWGNSYTCALVFDLENGKILVRERRTSKTGDEISEFPPAHFDDSNGTLPKHRAFRSVMRSLHAFCEPSNRTNKLTIQKMS